MPISNQTRNTNPRNQKKQKPISETDPMYSINPSTRSSKSTISSLLHTPFSPTSPTTKIFSKKKKKKKFTSFKGLSCKAATSQQVSLPSAIIRTSADWESSKKVKKKKKNKTLNFVGRDSSIIDNNCPSSCLAAPTDVWCGPGIGLTTDAASVDVLVSTRRPLSARGRVDIEKITPRERSSSSVRRMSRPEDDPFLDTETLEMQSSRANWFGFRRHRDSHYGFPEGLAEIVMLQNSLMGGRTNGLDRYRSWRLDVDNMSYEELLELGDRIGYVSTGLREAEITRCVRRTKPFFLNNLSHLRTEMEKKCSICQEEYEAEDEMGKLGCGHFYHIHCIKQWLLHKNSCPVCKSAAIPDS
ncbi:PREDICTED: uncharacterized protein LOC109235627 [Nicotiana attenuata]|uniref:RING-type E3 ubiquitin transferase n=1 Tax=Nicotiana attenuata TaxID=49451 RepID=A0A1J6IMD6_NICAT|nr:PREDICTED: uncharacterized protein LOC109235627 [Nicotiana attenuata]OIS96312.1 putative e3 ubiquitin-protein ligase hip1 [Nicotiana attenuata]